jgi:hypothetical protein
MQGQGVDCSSEESNQRVDAEIRYNLCPLVYVKATVTIYQSNPDAFMRREKGDQAHQVRQSLVLAVAGVASGARSRLRRRRGSVSGVANRGGGSVSVGRLC